MTAESPLWRDLVMLVTYGFLLLLTAARLALCRRFPLDEYERLALLLYVLNGAFAAVFFTRVRFRLPFDFLLISLCALFLAQLLERRAESRAHPRVD